MFVHLQFIVMFCLGQIISISIIIWIIQGRTQNMKYFGVLTFETVD